MTASCALTARPLMLRASLLAFMLCIVGRETSAAMSDSWVSEYPRVRAAAASTCARQALPACRRALLRLIGLLDGRIDTLYQLAKVEALLGHSSASLEYLEHYARSRLDFGDPADALEFRALRGLPRFRLLERNYRAGLAPAGTHLELASMPAPDLIAEDLALDSRDGARYVSSVHAGNVLRLGTDGSWSELLTAAQLSAWGIYGLAIDPARERLWLSSTAGAVSPPYRPADQGRSAILRVSLNNLAVEQRYELRDGRAHAFGDMAIGVQGEVYIADGVGGGIYRIGPEDNAQMETLLRPGALRSPQTPVPMPGGRRLLVADYSRGIAVIDLRHRHNISWLPHPPDLALYGIDGLYLHGRTLIAIQNGTTPERLLLLHMNSALSRVTGWDVALARAPGLGDPTHGVVRGDRFDFISNSGWDRVGDNGAFSAQAPATNPGLWSISLSD